MIVVTKNGTQVLENLKSNVYVQRFDKSGYILSKLSLYSFNPFDYVTSQTFGVSSCHIILIWW